MTSSDPVSLRPASQAILLGVRASTCGLQGAQAGSPEHPSPTDALPAAIAQVTGCPGG